MSLLRQPLLLLARSDRVKRLVTAMPVSAGIVRGYVPGEDTDAAVRATAELVDDHLKVSLDYLGEDTLDTDQADTTVQAYLDVLAALSARGLTRHAEVSVKLSAIGQAIAQQGHKIALENARTIARAARNAGTTVTLDMEDHTTTDATLATLRELRKDFPETGAVVQAYLHRTESDCRALAYEGSRVRLCKGAYDEPESVAFQSRTDVDRSYVRCLKVLMAGQGYPMVATHDPRPKVADGGPGLPDGPHARPAPGQHRVVTGEPLRPRRAQLRVPDALRHPPRRAAASRRGGRVRACLHPLRHRVVRLPHETSGRAPAEPDILRPVPDLQEVGALHVLDVAGHRHPRRR